MKKSLKIIIAIAVAVVVVAAVLIAILQTAGNGLDVVAKESVASFTKVLNALPGKITSGKVDAAWELEAPDGSVSFFWSEDYGKSPLYDVMLTFDATPFTDAGLDTSKLPENYVFSEGKLTVGSKLNGQNPADGGDTNPMAAYENIVRTSRSSVGYHAALDHYNVNVGEGNLFEWAKDMQKNSITGENQDKDIVFVLNPEPLIAAGVDPEKVEGWVYAQVPVEIDGKPEQVYKFLKPFDLK